MSLTTGNLLKKAIVCVISGTLAVSTLGNKTFWSTVRRTSPSQYASATSAAMCAWKMHAQRSSEEGKGNSKLAIFDQQMHVYEGGEPERIFITHPRDVVKGVFIIYPRGTVEGIFIIYHRGIAAGVFIIHPRDIQEGMLIIHPRGLVQGILMIHPRGLVGGISIIYPRGVVVLFGLDYLNSVK